MNRTTPSVDDLLDDVWDTRDLIELISSLDPEDEEEKEELERALTLQSEVEQASDYIYGETVIRDSYFIDYAQQLAEGVGALPRDPQWPMTHIDWEGAAEALQQDYTNFDFEGVTYWYRCT